MGTRALILLLVCAPLAAQSWDSLQSLQGKHVKVLDQGGKENKGICESVAADRITVSSGAQRVTIERAKVKRVQVRSGARRARNIAIGAAIGVGIGVTIDQTLGTYLRNESGFSGGDRAVSYIAPIAIFGGIGAVFSGYRTVYQVR